MGGPNTPDVQNQTRLELKQYLRYLPQILQATSNAQPGIDQTAAGSALNILRNFAPQAAAAGNQLTAGNTAAGATTVGNTIAGQGGANVQAASDLDRKINPEYYSTRSTIAGKTQDALGAINLTGLSPGESNAVERSLNQTNTANGNLGLINPTNTVSNAMNFGGAFNSKIPILNNTIATANSTLPAMQGSGYANTLGAALAQPPAAANTNFGMASLPGTGNQAYSSGQGLLGNFGQMQSTLQPLAYQGSFANSAQGYAHSFGENVNCCFIMLECLNGDLPWYVRLIRDYYYKRTPEVAIGYKKMANWLVPLMRRSKVVKGIVNLTVVKPLLCYGAYLCGLNKHGWILAPVKWFWFKIWRNF